MAAATATSRRRSTRSDVAATRIDAESIMQISNLELRAKAIVEGFFSGLHRSPLHGFSVEFTEYREYSPGDDLRFLDWKLFARSDRYYLKRFEDETNLRCSILLDLSRSMAYGSAAHTKMDYARTIAATLAYFLLGQRDAVGLWTFHEQVVDALPARYRPRQLHEILQLLETTTAGESTDLARPLEQLASSLRHRGMIVLISDLLAPLDMLRDQLAALRAQGHEVIVFRILDPRELDLQFDEPALFRDLETQKQLYVDPEALRSSYTQKFEQHQQQLTLICQELAIDLHRLTTDAPPQDVLFDFLTDRLRRGRQVLRRAGGSGSGVAG